MPCGPTATWRAFLPSPDAAPDGPEPAVERFIRENLRLEPARSLSGIRLYAAHAASRLDRLSGGREVAPAPYWAYPWAGGLALARHILDHPETVAGRRVLDLGCGSGVVAIAAARCGASAVRAVDVDPHAVAAARLNAQANGVTLERLCADIVDGAAPEAEVILGGDVFYDRALAERMLPFLRRCRDGGAEVLIGDPGRTPLPRARLEPIAEYAVADFGSGGREITGVVYRLAAD